MKALPKILVTMTLSFLVCAVSQPLGAQDSASAGNITLYMDRTTRQVFGAPGPNRLPLHIMGTLDAQAIAHQVEQEVESKTRAEAREVVAQSEAQQQAQQPMLAKQVAEMKPAWTSYLTNFQNKFRIGALAYLDYGLYTHTGFGPQFLENLNPPGPQNNFYNSFDINRIYLNTYFTPTNDLLFRFTPEIYRANGTASNDKLGTKTGVGSNLDGDLNVRLKYGYVQYTGLMDSISPLKGGSVAFGAQPNPFLPWEEDLYQYRFVYLAPWNYVGLSSSQIGLQFSGPIKLLGGETNYFDYGFGVYDNGNFRTPEQSNTKQVMARLTAYPFGAHWRYDGFGMTGFYNYGWGDTTPDNSGTVMPLKGSAAGSAHFERIAALLHYSTEQWNMIGEFDYGNNATTIGNMFSGSGPLDAFGTPTGNPITKSPAFGNSCAKATPCYPIFGTFGPQTAVYQAFQNNGRTRQLGLDFMGHYHIPGTRLTAFGMFQWFLPNDNVRENPLDFQRFVVGISYQFNEYFRIALDSQNLLFYHDQFGLPVSYADKLNYAAGKSFNGWLLPKSGSTIIPDLVPRDTHAIFANLEFAY